MGNTFTAASRCLALVSLVALTQRVFCAAEPASNPVPISVPPSQYWDGNDGPWSSFGVQIGTPPQSVRVLLSSSSSSLWAVLPEGCLPTDGADCPSSRGFTFRPNASSTWTDRGLFQLPLYPLDALGYSGNADYGFDNLTLAWQGQGGATVPHQVIAGIATKDFPTGMLGLSERPVNFTDFTHPEASLLSSLAAAGQIPSVSWGYLAGAAYRPRQPLASLTLGGYDAARLVPNTLTFPFGPDTSRPLLVAIQAITASTGASLLPSGIVVSIDSTVPQIWFPLAACRKFESAFGLEWDNATDLYLVNDTWHETLVARNTSVTLKLGPSVSGGDAVEIVLPYAALDLRYTATTGNLSSRYFPLRRAQNDTQFTLGRAFLQEAYLTVDYTRSNFSIAQAVYADANNPPSRLMPIRPPSASPAPPGAQNPHRLPLSAPAIAAIVASAVILPVLCATLVYLRYRTRHPALPPPAEMGGEAVVEMNATKAQELHGDGQLAAQEMEAEGNERKELGGREVVPLCELEGDQGEGRESVRWSWTASVRGSGSGSGTGEWANRGGFLDRWSRVLGSGRGGGGGESGRG